jgi:hypothetical protein
MSTSFMKRTKAQIEIVAETTATLPILLFNKTTIPMGRTRYIIFGGGTCYHFKKDKDKTQTASITDYVTVTTPTADRDWNDSTYASYNVPATATADVRLYDYGSVKTRFVYLVIRSAASNLTTLIQASEDGSTWTTIASAVSATVGAFLKATFRYLKWVGSNTYSSSLTTIVYTLEVFDPDDPTAYSTTGELVIEGYGDIAWVIIDGVGSTVYYVYDISQVKLVHTEGELTAG